MHKPSNRYILSVGEKEAERLQILNDLFCEKSQQWLLKSGLKKNSHVLEVGCGTGNMTICLAKMMGNFGHIFALDSSLEQINIAQLKAKQENLNNITFIHKTITQLNQFDLSPVDFIYSRFVIMHLNEPFKVLQHLLGFLKPYGKIVCEEATNTVTCCYPFSPVFQTYRHLLLTLNEKMELDNSLGEKLYFYFNQLKLKNIDVQFNQPILLHKQQKKMFVLLVQEIKENYLKYHIATEQEINQLLADLEEFIADDSYLVSFAKTTQIVGTV